MTPYIPEWLVELCNDSLIRIEDGVWYNQRLNALVLIDAMPKSHVRTHLKNMGLLMAMFERDIVIRFLDHAMQGSDVDASLTNKYGYILPIYLRPDLTENKKTSWKDFEHAMLMVSDAYSNVVEHHKTLKTIYASAVIRHNAWYMFKYYVKAKIDTLLGAFR